MRYIFSGNRPCGHIGHICIYGANKRLLKGSQGFPLGFWDFLKILKKNKIEKINNFLKINLKILLKFFKKYLFYIKIKLYI